MGGGVPRQDRQNHQHHNHQHHHQHHHHHYHPYHQYHHHHQHHHHASIIICIMVSTGAIWQGWLYKYWWFLWRTFGTRPDIHILNLLSDQDPTVSVEILR